MGDRSILFVGPAFGSVKSSLYWGKIWGFLFDRGVNVDVSTLRSLRPEDLNPGVGFYSASSPWLLGRAVRLYRFFGKKKYDNIYVNEFSSFSLIAVLVFYILGLTPRVVLMWENHPRYLAGYGKARDTAFHRVYRRFFLIFCAAILTNNEETKSYILENISKNTPITVVPYLVSDFSEYRRTDCDESNEDILRFISVGQLVPRKGFAEAISELELVRSEVKKCILWDIYGTGSEERVLKRLIGEAGLTDIVNLKGYVAYHLLPSIMAKSNVFLMPSYADYRSLATFEALTLGLPLLVSEKDGSHREAVVAGQNGYVFDPFEKGSLARAIERIFDERALLPQFAEISRDVSNKFMISNCLKAFGGMEAPSLGGVSR